LLAAPASATFPGRNGLIAFAADAGSGSQIYTVKPNGKRLRQVTHLDGDAVNPDWSPDAHDRLRSRHGRGRHRRRDAARWH
jgi:hypothetical protein